MRCEDVMTKDVKTIPPTALAEEAFQKMKTHQIHHLVVAGGGAFLGVISARDLGGPRAAAWRKVVTVGDLMADEPVTVEPTTTIKRAANVMRGQSVGSLLVVADGKLVGILTISDLLDLIGRGIERSGPAEKKRQSPRPGGRRGPARPRRAVRGPR